MNTLDSDAYGPARRMAARYLAGLLCAAALLAALHWPLADLSFAGIRWFDLDAEENLSTWFTGVLFCLLGIAGLVAYALERRANARAGYRVFHMPVLWLGVALAGLGMSLDEVTILHEDLFWREVRDVTMYRSWTLTYVAQWQILFAPVILLVLGYFVLFFNNRYGASRSARRAAFAGIGVWVMALFLESVRGFFTMRGAGWYATEVLIEEFFEMGGAILLMGSVALYGIDIACDLSATRRARFTAAGRFFTGRALASLASLAIVLTGSAGVTVGIARWLAREDARAPRLHGRGLASPAVAARGAVHPRSFSRAGHPDLAAVRLAIGRSAAYLVRHTRADGMFDYCVNMDPDVRMEEEYDIERHAGAVYALAVYNERHPDSDARAAMRRAARYLLDHAVAPVPDRDDLLAVWSKPEGGGGDEWLLRATPGGAGLGLVALLSAERVSPGSVRLEDLRRLGRFLVYMQKADGSFYSGYSPSRGGRDDSGPSPCCPGEAALGLIMLHEADPSEEWFGAAARALAYLARTRWGLYGVRHVARTRWGLHGVPADHWELLATARLATVAGGGRPIVGGAVLMHTADICDGMIEEQILGATATPRTYGGFVPDGRTAPAAMRLEGLLAALAVVPEYHPLRERIMAAVGPGFGFLLRAHVAEGEFAGAMPRAAARLPGLTSEERAFNARATEVRIDYVQHALCAMIQYARYAEEQP